MDNRFDDWVFAKNWQRLSEDEVATEFLLEIVEQARNQPASGGSEEHPEVAKKFLEV